MIKSYFQKPVHLGRRVVVADVTLSRVRAQEQSARHPVGQHRVRPLTRTQVLLVSKILFKVQFVKVHVMLKSLKKLRYCHLHVTWVKMEEHSLLPDRHKALVKPGPLRGLTLALRLDQILASGKDNTHGSRFLE